MPARAAESLFSYLAVYGCVVSVPLARAMDPFSIDAPCFFGPTSLSQHMRATGYLDVPHDKEFRTLIMPMDPDLALMEIPSVFYKVFKDEFKDYYGNEFEISHRSGYYRLWKGGYLKGFYVGKDISIFELLTPFLRRWSTRFPLQGFTSIT
ncbi:hypothetical protein PIB30_085395 [Stylosanthes scabra]|uniref:Uncharacterized protein n=1 Tax=Stylosanthes scabra TaxID=79078 RepID=A0ABU6XRV3_9FABA|nr:hypothetical protein [Stylosanthes scabra]